MEAIGVENVAPVLMPPTVKAPKKRVRPYKARLATKVRWALEDAMERTVGAQRRMRRVLERLEALHAMPQADRELMAHVGKLEHELLGLALEVAELERIVNQAVAESRPLQASGKAGGGDGSKPGASAGRIGSAKGEPIRS